MVVKNSSARRVAVVVDRFLSSVPRRGIEALSVCLVGLLFVIDLKTGYELAFSVFYLVPISAAAWYAGSRSALLVALLSAICWVAADIGAGAHYSSKAIPIWNAVVRLGFFLITAGLLISFKRALVRERALARTDHLTGLMTRQAFEERLLHDIDVMSRQGSAIAVVYIDLDRFKEVNDQQGHLEGDRALKMAANVLSENTRRADGAARLGGDEFALSLPGADRAGVNTLCNKLRTEIRIAMVAAGYPVSASIGVTLCSDPANTSVEKLLAAADAAMYEAKKLRNEVVIHE